MIVSWTWLRDYLNLSMTPGEAAHRLTMAGLNHESTEQVGEDFAIDLEVTSNRPDCLGHLGIAREIAVLWDLSLHIPQAWPESSAPAAADQVRVRIDCPDLCPQYTARVIGGVQVGPSPKWLAQRLQAVGVNVINNLVDVTNYVMLECGQPLHAFDYDTLHGKQIVVRRAAANERLEAIDHRSYALMPDDCVIADASRAVALGGVMGGAETEVSEATVNVLVEAAEFAPLSIRSTARRLKLHSPSSYRFERGVDPAGVDWASRRCCELILKTAGGRLCEGVVVAGGPRPEPQPIRLRFAQLSRILGVDISAEEARRILQALGCIQQRADASQVRVIPPTWRRDLVREVDLIEEVARIHGYDKIPEDVSVPMVPSHKRRDERVLQAVRHVMTAAGMDEAVTISLVPDDWSDLFSPWTDQPAIRCEAAMIQGADVLRRSLTPSLLNARRLNESIGNEEIELFETARVYLAQAGDRPVEQWTLGLISETEFSQVKGVLEHLVQRLIPGQRIHTQPGAWPVLDPAKSGALLLDGQRWGVLGEVSEETRGKFKLRGLATIAELDLDLLTRLARLVRTTQPQSPFPAIEQDLNFILSEHVRWEDLHHTVTEAAGDLLERIHYRETYRDQQRDGAGFKRILLAILLRSAKETLTGEQAEAIRQRICDAVASQHQGRLVA